MRAFVNTVDIVGDDALTDSILQRTISGEFNDNRITKVGTDAFRNCMSLTKVNLPSVVTLSNHAFAWCGKLDTADLASVESIIDAFAWCWALRTIIIRNQSGVCTLANGFISDSPLGKGTGQIFVPTALLDAYREATNWSAYADQFFALEEWTDDGTVYGDIISGYTVGYRLFYVSSSNRTSKTGNRYTATLIAATEIEEVSITMGGVDITAEVYNAETGEINIPLVTGDLVITAKAQAPASGDGDLPDGYTALTYIASTTTVTGANAVSGAYIDTGIFPSDTLSIECNMAALGTSSEFSGIGAVERDSKGWIRAGSYATGTLMSMFCAGSRNGAANIPFDNDFHTFFLENGYQSIDGANDTYLTGSPTFTSSARIYLFAAWIGFAATQVYKTAISWCKIRDNGELIKDYVACIRDSDGAIGMYDRVTGEFVGNSGSGEFTAGDVISGGNTVSCEKGTINWQTGANADNATRCRTDFMPYSHSFNEFSIDALLNGFDDVRVIVYPYDSNHVFLGDNFSSSISPSAVSGWAVNKTAYTIDYGSDVAYVRAFFSNSANDEVASLSGKITVSGVEYDLVWED